MLSSGAITARRWPTITATAETLETEAETGVAIEGHRPA